MKSYSDNIIDTDKIKVHVEDKISESHSVIHTHLLKIWAFVVVQVVFNTGIILYIATHN